MNKFNKFIYLFNNRSSLLLWLIFTVALSLRIYNLGAHNLWYDEFVSFLDSNQNKLARPPFYAQFQLYIFLLRLWTIFFGISEFSLRSLSMLFGVLSVVLIYQLGRLLFNKKVGLASAFILAISPLHIWYSQEARAYSLSIFLSMLMVFLFFSALRNNKPHLWAWFIVSSILGLYTNYFCFYILFVTGMTFFIKEYRILLSRWVVSLCLIFVAFLPITSIFIKRFIAIKNSFWSLKPHLNTVLGTFYHFNVGYNATANFYLFSFIIFSLLFFLGILYWGREKKQISICLCGYIFIPIATTFIISQWVPIYIDRQLMLFSPFYYIIVAAGLVKIRSNILSTGVYLYILLITVFCIHNYFSFRMPFPAPHIYLKKPVKPAADYMKKEFIKGDAIGYAGPTTTSLFYYMWDKIINEKITVFSFVIKSKLHPYWLMREGVCYAGGLITKHIIMLEDNESIKKFKSYNLKRLWVISSSWERGKKIGYYAQAVGDWFRERYFLAKRREFDGIFVDLYYIK